MSVRHRCACAKLGVDLLVDEELRSSVVAQGDKAFNFEEFDPVQVKGYDDPVTFYNPVLKQQPSRQRRISTFQQLRRASALRRYFAGGASAERDSMQRFMQHFLLIGPSRAFHSWVDFWRSTLKNKLLLHDVVQKWGRRSLNSAFCSWIDHGDSLRRARDILRRTISKMLNKLLFACFDGWLQLVQLAHTGAEASAVLQAGALHKLNLREMTASKIASVISMSSPSFTRSMILSLHPSGLPVLIDDALSRLVDTRIFNRITHPKMSATDSQASGLSPAGSDTVYSFADPKLSMHIYESMTLQQVCE